MFPVAELTHCTLYADKHEDYFTKTVNYLVQSHTKDRAWRITRHNFLGPEGGFLINGRGDSFPSAFSAAKHIDASLGRVKTDA
jgi:hypothetical protein